MSYYCIKFLKSKEVEAVPSSWVDGSKCLWPSSMSLSKLYKAIKESKQPEPDWKEHEIKIYKTYSEYSNNCCCIEYNL